MISWLKQRWKAWNALSAHHRSYVVYGLGVAVVMVALIPAVVNSDDATCLRTSVVAKASSTVTNFADDQCDEEPFEAVRDAFTGRSVPAFDEDLGITATSARAWIVVHAALFAATAASAVAGAAMAVIGSRPDANRSGWVWGACLAGAGVVVAAILSAAGNRSLMVASFGERQVDYSTLLDPLAAWLTWVSVIGGAVMTAAVVAVGHRLNGLTNDQSHQLSVEEVRRASRSVTILLAALTATLSLGVLSTGARFRLMEHLPGAGDIPGLIGVLYGALFTVLIAALFIPTQTRLGAARRRLLDMEAGTGLSEAVVARRKAVRQELDHELGVGGFAGTTATVLGPFLAAAASSVLS